MCDTCVCEAIPGPGLVGLSLSLSLETASRFSRTLEHALAGSVLCVREWGHAVCCLTCLVLRRTSNKHRQGPRDPIRSLGVSVCVRSAEPKMLPWYACHGTPDVTEPPLSSRVFPTTVMLSHLRHHSLVLSVYALACCLFPFAHLRMYMDAKPQRAGSTGPALFGERRRHSGASPEIHRRSK